MATKGDRTLSFEPLGWVFESLLSCLAMHAILGLELILQLVCASLLFLSKPLFDSIFIYIENQHCTMHIFSLKSASVLMKFRIKYINP